MESLQQAWLDCYESWKLPDLALLENNAGPLRHDVNASSPILTVTLHVVIYALQPDNSSLYLILLQNRQKVKALEQQLKVAGQLAVQQFVNSTLVHDLNATVNTMRMTLE